MPQEYILPQYFGGSAVVLRPIQLHGIAYGVFASLVAPFGGFLASAIKRGYDIKDFDKIIPGHGGLMDRMDCQLIIHLFTYVHIKSFVIGATTLTGVSSILKAAAHLSPEDLATLHHEIRMLVEVSSTAV
jgi:phosphatidate cytidylyltransferase